jgi:type IV pilus assembly protein PilA
MTGSPRNTGKCGGQARGFSIVEALVVVMIILVIAAVAIPNMLQARIKANEGAAVASLHTIQVAETLYFDTYPEIGYASHLADLGRHGTDCKLPGTINACIIMDEALTSGLKSGYIFAILTDGSKPASAYTATATPQVIGSSGNCSYRSSQGGEIQAISTNNNAGRFTTANTACGQS